MGGFHPTLVNLPLWRTCHHSSRVLMFQVLMPGCSAAIKWQLCLTKLACHMFRSLILKTFPYFGRFWSCFPALLNMFCHHSYSTSASAELSSSSTPQCGAHSSSNAKAICSSSNLFFKNDNDNNNNNNKCDASTQKFHVDTFLLIDYVD